jgi:hypothetical protein
MLDFTRHAGKVARVFGDPLANISSGGGDPLVSPEPFQPLPPLSFRKKTHYGFIVRVLVS